MIDVTMPVLGLTMEQGTLVAWLKEIGETVQEGEPLFMVETDKATSDAPAPASGILAAKMALEGDTVPVGATIALIAQSAEEFAALTSTKVASVDAPKVEPFHASAKEGSATAPQPESPPAPPSDIERTVFASPRAKRRARELGIEVRAVPHEGPRVLEHHVLAAATQVKPLTRVRRLIAERMTLSATTVPQVTYRLRADITDLMELRKTLRPQAAQRKVNLPLDLFVARAVTRALIEQPEVNSEWVEGLGIRQHTQINLAVAVDVEGSGLLTPVIHDAASLSFWDTALELDRLLSGVKAKKLGPDDFAGATFTISSLAVTGVESFDPLVVPPQAAILGVGAPVTAPAYLREDLVKRRFLTLCLTTDHRILDGTPSARFVGRVRELLESPQGLL